MKKTFLILLSFFLFLDNFAFERSIEQLKSIAYKQLVQSSRKKAKGLSCSDDVKLLLQKEELVVMGVDGVGFAVLTVDDSNTPVIGYSDSEFNSSINNINLLWWMETANHALANGAKTRKASLVPQDLPSSVSPYVEAIWDQTAPYNNFAPTYNTPSGKKHYPTGCVATAMAEAMYMYKYPSSGTGLVHNSFDGNDGMGAQFVSLQLDTLHFDWGNMLPVYRNDYSASEANAVAGLMYACGISIQMGYTPSGSGAFTHEAYTTLVEHFGYSSNVPYYYRDMVSLSEWSNHVYRYIAKQVPLIFGAVSSLGGHCFVIDGYAEDGLVHVNWGWGTNGGNGFYDLSILDGYAQKQNFFPVVINAEGEHHSMIGIYNGGFYVEQRTATHLAFNVESLIYNIDPYPYSGKLYIIARDINDGSDYILATQNLDESKYTYLTPVLRGLSKPLVTISKKIGDGTYRIFLASKSEGESAYQPVRCKEEYVNSYLLKVSGGEITFLLEDLESGWVGATEINTPYIYKELDRGKNFNIVGQQVDSRYKGIVIKDSKKYFMK